MRIDTFWCQALPLVVLVLLGAGSSTGRLSAALVLLALALFGARTERRWLATPADPRLLPQR